MRLDRDFADSELGGHLFVEHPRDYQGHHFLFPLGQRCEVVALLLQQTLTAQRFATSLDCLVDRNQENVIRKWLRQELHCPSFHRFHRHRYITVSSDEDNRYVSAIVRDALLQLQAVEPRHRNVEHQTTWDSTARAGKKFGGGCERRRTPPFGLNQQFKRFAHGYVVVDDEDNRLSVRHGRHLESGPAPYAPIILSCTRRRFNSALSPNGAPLEERLR